MRKFLAFSRSKEMSVPEIVKADVASSSVKILGVIFPFVPVRGAASAPE